MESFLENSCYNSFLEIKNTVNSGLYFGCPDFMKSKLTPHRLPTDSQPSPSQLPANSKVIIEKTHGEVSLMGQDTIENVS